MAEDTRKYPLTYIIVAIIIGLGAFLFIRGGKTHLHLGYDTEGQSARGTNEVAGISVVKERVRWGKRIDDVGAKQAYEEFKNEYKGKDVELQHPAAHIFGELLYEKEGLGGLAVCDSTFAFGCYHSFFARALGEHGPSVVRDLDKVCVDKYGPLGTGCQHGIGHGILEYMGHDKVVPALEDCKMTTQLKELFGCTSGVFMEYNLPVFITNGSSSLQIRPLNRADPYEPCDTIIPENFKKSCYYELAQWWESVFGGGDFKKMGSLCGGIEEGTFKEYCYLGIGNVAAPSSGYDVAKTIAKCTLMPTEGGELVCRAGASWSMFAAPEFRSRAPLVCEGLSTQESVLCIKKSDLIGNGEINPPVKN